MNIVVIGSGYVGTTAAAIFSVSGHNVVAIDIDQKKVDLINSGKAPFFEAGLDNLISWAVNNGSLRATSEYAEAVKDADAIFSCVGTPDNPDGSSNLSYVFQSAKEAAEHMKPGAVFVQKSTVPVGTGRKVIDLLPDTVSYVSNPEFLRESTAVYDTLFFDRVVAGGDDKAACEIILDIHRSVEAASAKIAEVSAIDVDTAKLSTHTGQYIATRLESAELIKVTSNAFLALKISFSNSIAQLCDKTGADILEVMDVVGSDQRIGRAFLGAGRGYGGGCFPKDVSGLISSAKEFEVDMPIMTAASSVNAMMPEYVISKLKLAAGDMVNQKVAVLGLAFKSGTSDARKSPAIKIANLLAAEGALVSAYDPEANEEARHDLSSDVSVVESTREAVQDAAIVVIATDWPEFKYTEQWRDQATSMKIIVDSVNCLTHEQVQALNAAYIGIGKIA